MTVGDAKRRVKLTIENTINALQGMYSLNQTQSESGSNSIYRKIAKTTRTLLEHELVYNTNKMQKTYYVI